MFKYRVNDKGAVEIELTSGKWFYIGTSENVQKMNPDRIEQEVCLALALAREKMARGGMPMQ